jgi:hypothetical protein
MNAETIVNRRTFMRSAGVAGAGLVVATRTPVASLFGSADAAAAGTCASLTPSKTIGPYFVEEKLNRSDIRTDPATGAVTTGVPLVLNLALVNEDGGCEPFAGAQVDIWHADPSGKYSDESVEGIRSSTCRRRRRAVDRVAARRAGDADRSAAHDCHACEQPDASARCSAPCLPCWRRPPRTPRSRHCPSRQGSRRSRELVMGRR